MYNKVFIHRSKGTIQEEGLGFTSTGSSVKDNFIGDDKEGVEDKGAGVDDVEVGVFGNRGGKLIEF